MANKDMNIGSVYVVRGGDLFKIGSSGAPQIRISSLRGSSPVPLHLEYSFKAAYYKEVEKLLHRRFKDRHVRGEWFCLTDEELEIIKNLPALEYDWRKDTESIFSCSLPKPKKVRSRMIFARVEKSLVDQLKEAATVTGLSSSTIVREAVKAELDRIEGKSK